MDQKNIVIASNLHIMWMDAKATSFEKKVTISQRKKGPKPKSLSMAKMKDHLTLSYAFFKIGFDKQRFMA